MNKSCKKIINEATVNKESRVVISFIETQKIWQQGNFVKDMS